MIPKPTPHPVDAATEDDLFPLEVPAPKAGSFAPKAAGLAGKAVQSAFSSLSTLAPPLRIAGQIGAQAAHIAYFAGAASQAHAQIAMGRAVLSAGKAAAMGRSTAVRIARMASPNTASEPGSIAGRAAAAASFGASLAIETYPLWMAIIRLAGSHGVTFSPTDLNSVNSSPLPLDQAMIVSGENSISEASRSLGRLLAQRRRRAKKSDSVPATSSIANLPLLALAMGAFGAVAKLAQARSLTARTSPACPPLADPNNDLTPHGAETRVGQGSSTPSSTLPSVQSKRPRP